MTRYVLDARTVTPHFPGIGRYVRNLAAALPAHMAADEALTLLIPPAPVDAAASDWSAPGAEIVTEPASPFGLAQQWRIPRRLTRMRRAGAPARLLYHSAYYLMPYRPGVPTVLTVYDLIALLYRQTVSRRAALFFRLAHRLALAAADHVIAISEATRRDLLAHFPIEPARVTTIPLAPAPHFRPQPAGIVAAARTRFGLPQDYLFYFGINKPHKNLLRLVDAYAQLDASVPPLVIAGAWDPRYPEARRHAASLGDRVRFLGPLADADLLPLLTGCTLFVFPSLYEGYGLPVAEAMACGAAVACANTSSLPEVAGDAALLFNPTSVDAIAVALRSALDSPARLADLRSRSLARAATLTWSSTAQQTLAVYRSLRA
jgi:alpha-1,3-rhamnosyl/mannosyltransferase